MTVARLSGITYYPVKGCAGTAVPEATLTRAGLPGDRVYAIADEKGDPRWQGGDPALALITPELTEGELTLRAPGRDSIPADSADVHAWLTDVLGVPSTLVRCPAGNGGRLHLVSQASLDALNHRLAARGATPVPMDRFRPNLVVDGWDAPHTEDGAARLVVGGTELAFTEETIRCAVTMVDQRTGLRSGPEPLRTLADYRRAADGGLAFGAYFEVRRPGGLTVGDEVTVGTR
ncbi:molybdenum cofactor sulfurase [Streptomyces humidus]|uniref:Molybdenum cofactor sulfurase n=1 Tax=Streptomyces humidus TaxID=52259 RepID=A0A918FRR6_9ACTN|nr:MOSC N-terminal beta barrel domain-containing protein [Streptomyces humidus]GGR73814.1 molybdenum cofactor sulfurase [Streptomyces humidus]